MDIKEIIFWSLSTIAFITAIYTVIAKNPIFSAISLLVCFASIAGHYLLLNAQFLFIVHIIVYAGAIMVLFLTTLMLMNLNEETEKHKPAIAQIAALVIAVALGIVLMLAVRKANVILTMGPMTDSIGDVKSLGTVLLSEYFYPFEFISVLLLSAMVGVVLLMKKDKTAALK
ncbi:MAG: NADH-quinone oxidoreductase subunit J [Bacteroidetes bacterium]|nr:NADH-quinone oxidoreductase subunit J [Bacteroidota bacterium]MBS1683729.1 NADH-quinone oxidoreductase subunit J [Bacteroidota bacterium]